MELFDDINIFLPQYLSDISREKLIEELKSFPSDGTKDNIYTSVLEKEEILYQGDGIAEMPYIHFPNTDIGNVPAILLSNTCDMSAENKRMYPSHILYVPLINLEKYQKGLLKIYDKNKVESHINDIKKQIVTSVLYLPKGAKLDHDSIVFLDQAINYPVNEDFEKNMCKKKLFTLSNFGFYLFLLKLSIHFTRIFERIDRNTGEDKSKE